MRFIQHWLFTQPVFLVYINILTMSCYFSEFRYVEAIWKGKTVGKGAEFSLTVSNFILEDRDLILLKEGKQLTKVQLEITPSLPVLFFGWLAFGIPYLWVSAVKEYQMFDLSVDLKRAATEVSPQ